jgi:hypothetical protein
VTDRRHPAACLLEAAVFAPIGLALAVGERLPDQVRRGARLVEERVRVARAFGELAVRFGRAEIERELRAASGDDRDRPAAVDEVPLDETSSDHGSAAPDADLPSAATLPISDYENLAAIHVVQRLGSLRDDEIEQIRRFEVAHRARRTVLAKIDSLQEARTA